MPEMLTGDIRSARERFIAQHDNRYGHAAPTSRSIEIVNLRLVVTSRAQDTHRRTMAGAAMGRGACARDSARGRCSTIPAKPVEARIVWRPALAAGQREIVGPAVIEEPNSTTFDPAGRPCDDRA